MSHPVWVRGLKLNVIVAEEDLKLVAPRVGAWIETLGLYQDGLIRPVSHPVWVRGLKR